MHTNKNQPNIFNVVASFYVPFAAVLLNYTTLGFNRTGEILLPLLYKTTGILRGASIFFGFLMGKMTKKFV